MTAKRDRVSATIFNAKVESVKRRLDTQLGLVLSLRSYAELTTAKGYDSFHSDPVISLSKVSAIFMILCLAAAGAVFAVMLPFKAVKSQECLICRTQRRAICYLWFPRRS